jgi:ubiquitin-conjugating enzyme E2 variant
MNALLELAIGLFAADFVSGLVHWAEDTFGTESTPVVGRWIVVPNVLHHRDPAAFVGKSWLASNWDLAAASLVLLGIATACGWFGPGIVIFALASANANQLHKWAHAPAQAPRLVRALWRTRLLQSPRDHARHHVGEKNEAYCVVTPFLNPLLDRLRFWRAIERLTVPFFGAPRRQDLSLQRVLRVHRSRSRIVLRATIPLPRGWRESAARLRG